MFYSITAVDWENKTHCRAIKKCIRIYMADPMGKGPGHSCAEQELLIDGLIAHPKSICFLAFVKEKPAGCIICFENFSTFHVRPVINIHDLMVVPVFRGVGIGRALLQRAIEEAVRRNCAKITLEVRSDNKTAQALYLSEDFKECSPPMKFWVKWV